MTAVITTLSLFAAAVAAQSVPEKVIAAGDWKQSRAIVDSRLGRISGHP